MEKNLDRQSSFKLSNGTEFSIRHNIPTGGRLGEINTVDAAFKNWLIRTDDYTAQSFCDYINKKGMHQAEVIAECR